MGNKGKYYIEIMQGVSSMIPCEPPVSNEQEV